MALSLAIGTIGGGTFVALDNSDAAAGGGTDGLPIEIINQINNLQNLTPNKIHAAINSVTQDWQTDRKSVV